MNSTLFLLLLVFCSTATLAASEEDLQTELVDRSEDQLSELDDDVFNHIFAISHVGDKLRLKSTSKGNNRRLTLTPEDHVQSTIHSSIQADLATRLNNSGTTRPWSKEYIKQQLTEMFLAAIYPMRNTPRAAALIDSVEKHSLALNRAAYNSNVEGTRLLLRSGKLNFKDHFLKDLCQTAFARFPPMAEDLRQPQPDDPRHGIVDEVNAATSPNEIKAAAETISILLKDHRVDPAKNNYGAFIMAITGGYPEVVQSYMESGRISKEELKEILSEVEVHNDVRPIFSGIL